MAASMIRPDPKMSDELFADCIDYGMDPASVHDIDELMVRYWDEVSEAVLATAEKYHTTPLYVIEEFCVDSDWPDEVEFERD